MWIIVTRIGTASIKDSVHSSPLAPQVENLFQKLTSNLATTHSARNKSRAPARVLSCQKKMT